MSKDLEPWVHDFNFKRSDNKPTKFEQELEEYDSQFNKEMHTTPNEFDNVSKPEHYNEYSLETIEAISGQSTPEEFDGWLKGNIIKYIARYKFKNGIDDLHKAQFYLKTLTDFTKGYDIRDIIDKREEETND